MDKTQEEKFEKKRDKEKHHEKHKIIKEVMFISIFVLGAIMIFKLLNKNTIWYDEAFGMCITKKPYSEMLRLLTLDVHPPLYYIIMKFIIDIVGQYFIAYRAISAVPIMLAILSMGVFLKKNYSMTSALLYIILMLGAPSLLHFSVEVRMYGLCMLFVNLSFIAAFYLIKKQTFFRYLWFGFFCLCAAYTHYFAGAAVLGISFIAFFVILKKSEEKLKVIGNWIGWTICMTAAYLPWLKFFLQQCATVKSNFWLDVSTIDIAKSIPQYYLSTNNTTLTILLCVTVTVGLVLALIQGKKKANGKYVFLLLLSVLFPIVVGLGVSALVRPIFQAKYIFPVLSLFWVVVAIGLSYLSEIKVFKLTGFIATIAVMVICGLNFYQEYNEIYKESTDHEVSRMRELMDEQMEEGSPILQTSPQLFGCFSCYYPNNRQYILESYLDAEYFPAWEQLGKVSTINDYEELASELKDIWVVTDTYHPELKENLEECGYTVEEKGKFEWVTYTGFDIIVYHAKKH